MLNIDLRSATPIYEQICKKILEMIIKGELKADDKLPSVRELAKDLGINPNTVAKAFRILEQDNVICTLAGRGCFIADVKADIIKETALRDFDAAVGEALTAGISKKELTKRIDNFSG